MATRRKQHCSDARAAELAALRETIDRVEAAARQGGHWDVVLRGFYLRAKLDEMERGLAVAVARGSTPEA
jgi:hypothetical protein